MTHVHVGCVQDIQAYTKTSGEFPYPIIADPDRSIAKTLGMIDPDEVDMHGMPLTCRAVSCLFYLSVICKYYYWTIIE